MDDRECVLLDFINEENKIAVGFREWFYDDEFKADDECQKLVDSGREIVIRWPKNRDVTPVATMKKTVRNCDWQKTVAQVLAFGSTYMHCVILQLPYLNVRTS